MVGNHDPPVGEKRGRNWATLIISLISLGVAISAGYYTSLQAGAASRNNELLMEQNRILLHEQDIRLRPWVGPADTQFEIIDILTEKKGWLGRTLTKAIRDKSAIYDEDLYGRRLQFRLEYVFSNSGSTPAFNLTIRSVPKLNSEPQKRDLPPIGGITSLLPNERLYHRPMLNGSLVEQMVLNRQRLFTYILIEYDFKTLSESSQKGCYELLVEHTPDGNPVLRSRPEC